MLHRRGDRRARLGTGEHQRRHLKGDGRRDDPRRIGPGWLRQNDSRSPIGPRRQRHGCSQGRSESAVQAGKQRPGLELFNAGKLCVCRPPATRPKSDGHGMPPSCPSIDRSPWRDEPLLPSVGDDESPARGSTIRRDSAPLPSGGRRPRRGERPGSLTATRPGSRLCGIKGGKRTYLPRLIAAAKDRSCGGGAGGPQGYPARSALLRAEHDRTGCPDGVAGTSRRPTWVALPEREPIHGGLSFFPRLAKSP